MMDLMCISITIHQNLCILTFDPLASFLTECLSLISHQVKKVYLLLSGYHH